MLSKEMRPSVSSSKFVDQAKPLCCLPARRWSREPEGRSARPLVIVSRLPALAASADGTVVVTTSISEFLSFRISKFDPRRTQWQPPGEPVRLPERLHQGSQSASPAREMSSRGRVRSKFATVATAARSGRVAKSSAWPATVMRERGGGTAWLDTWHKEGVYGRSLG